MRRGIRADADYIYDPDHEKKPGGEYHQTDSGWSKAKDEQRPASPSSKTKSNPAPIHTQEKIDSAVDKAIEEALGSSRPKGSKIPVTSFDPAQFNGKEVSNDYTDGGEKGCSLDVVHQNIYANLEGDPSKVDKSVEIKKNSSTSALSKESSSQFKESTRANVKSLLDRYHGQVASLGLRAHLEKHVDNYLNAIDEGVKDGSLSDVRECDLDELVRHDTINILHQQAETSKRQFGDHGVRHNVGNSMNALKMLGELQKSGAKITGRDKLMMQTAMSSHDMGYGVGEVVQDPMMGGLHKKYSAMIAHNDSAVYVNVFGGEGAKKIENLILTHDKCTRDEVGADGKPVQQTDKEGKINLGRMYTLMRYEIDDAEWTQAMQALHTAAFTT